MLKVVDLFSGIGCFSYAFRGLFRTVVYCEIAKECRHMLRRNMERDRIDTAPIVRDVKDLHDAKGAQVLTAGFPCQDLSGANRFGQGLDGARSGLFFEIIRILDENPSICHVFLENVPALMQSYDTVLDGLKSVGFRTVKHVIVSAAQLGAPHMRKRVFIYAIRKKTKALMPRMDEPDDTWEPRTMPKLTTRYKSKDHLKQIDLRHKACGNAIVPACIVSAYRYLVHGIELPDKHRPIKVVLVDGDVVYRKERFNTPSASFLRPYNMLTERGSGVLCNNVKFNKKNKERDVENSTMNPKFSEWLMGLPSNYTRI